MAVRSLHHESAQPQTTVLLLSASVFHILILSLPTSVFCLNFPFLLPAECGGCDVWVFGAWLSKSRLGGSGAGFGGCGKPRTLLIRPRHFLLIRLIDGYGTRAPRSHFPSISSLGAGLSSPDTSSASSRLSADVRINTTRARTMPAAAAHRTASSAGRLRRSGE